MTEKAGYLSNIRSFINNKKDQLKEKFPTIFKKNNPEAVTQKQVPNQKPIFTIEEDEDHKIYNYHDDDEDDYDYVEDGDEIEEEKKEEEVKTKDKTPEKRRKKTDPEIKEQPQSDQEIDYDPYDPNTVCHRIYLKDTLIDLDGMSYLKCKRLKASNKIFSMIGVIYI
jgi:hypothetical protein